MTDYTIKVSASNYAAATAFDDFYDLYYIKEKNKISQFNFVAYNLSAAQIALLKIDNIVYIHYGTTLILKAKIGNIKEDELIDDYYVKGYGMEVDLRNRVVNGMEEWDTTAADTIIKEMIAGIIHGGTIESAPDVDYNIEGGNKLDVCIAIARMVGWDWYVTQRTELYISSALFPSDTLYPNSAAPGTSDYFDEFNFTEDRGTTDSFPSSTLYPSATLYPDFGQEIYEVYEDVYEKEDEEDLENIFNLIRVLGPGNGVNQIMSETFHATTNRVTLVSAISASSTSVTVNEDISSFPASGNLRCGREWLVYSSKNDGTKTFTISERGHIPGTNTPTSNPYYIAAYAHNADRVLFDLQYSDGGFAEKAQAQTDSSIEKYGIKERAYLDTKIETQNVADIIAEAYLDAYYDSAINIKLRSTKELLAADIGDKVKVIDKDGNSVNERLRKLEFDANNYSMKLEVGDKQEFLEEHLLRFTRTLASGNMEKDAQLAVGTITAISGDEATVQLEDDGSYVTARLINQ